MRFARSGEGEGCGVNGCDLGEWGRREIGKNGGVDVFFPKKSCQLAIIHYFCTRKSQKYAAVAQLVEHWLPKPRVAGSSPVCRSKN